MSHFSVLVLTTDESPSVDELLDPYCESNTCAPHIEYTKQEAIDYVRKHYPDFTDKSDEECWKFMAEGFITDKQGNIYSTANPDGRWDWYEKGGRWKDFLRLKDGTRATSAKLRDIDFGPDETAYKYSLRFWDLLIENKPLESGEEMPFSLYKPEYYKELYGNRENYAKRQAGFYTFAVITPNGIWYEKGQCGWFGCSSETAEESREWEENFIKNFINDEDGDTVATIVDCHI